MTVNIGYFEQADEMPSQPGRLLRRFAPRKDHFVRGRARTLQETTSAQECGRYNKTTLVRHGVRTLQVGVNAMAGAIRTMDPEAESSISGGPIASGRDTASRRSR